VFSREVDQLTSSHHHGADLRRSRNRDPSTATKFQQTFVTQYAKGTKDGVGVDVQHGGQISGRWQALPASGFAVRDSPSKFGRDLIMESDRFLGGQLDTQHGAR